MKSEQSGGSPLCKICSSDSDETISHVISTCQGLAVERERILKQFEELCLSTKNLIRFEDIKNNEDLLCQFILDPTSLNLPSRVSLQDPLVPEFFELARDYCFLLDKTRIRLLKQLEDKQIQH